MALWGYKDFSMTHMNSKEGQNSNMAAGVGANAKSRTDMKSFVGSDTLAELVWSPQEGLSIKFADKKPCFMWEGGPSDITGESFRLLRNIKSSHKQKATEELSDHLFENGVPSCFNGTGFNIKSHLETEEVMTQCGPEEHFEKAIVKIEKDGSENAQNAILESNKHLDCHENDENKHEIESHGSVESCKSGKGKRSLSFEQQLVFGSKRHKKQSEGCFISWISNMLNDLKNLEKNQSFCDINRRKMGFQSVSRCLSLPDIDKYNHGSLGLLKIKDKEDNNIVVKHISLYERVTKEAPKGLFDTIRRLRLSRTDILKWTNSRSSFANLDGFFLRLRIAKWEEGAQGSRYYVACIRGIQGENPRGDLKQPICVKVGGVECFVESQYISNCDFLEDELVAWLQKTSGNGRTPFVKDMTLKLAERKALGL